MATGAGKSLSFLVPMLISKGIAVVISPLLALMQDQVFGLVRKGINSAFINSALSSVQRAVVEERLFSGQIKILYAASESSIFHENSCEKLRELGVSFLAVDEAHCISRWGSGFRPVYRKILEYALPLEDHL